MLNERPSLPEGFIDKMISLAQYDFRDGIVDGCECPICGRRAQIYTTRMMALWAFVLLKVWRSAGFDWFHNKDFCAELYKADTISSPDAFCGFAKMRHWGLLEKGTEGKEDGNPNSSNYRITPKGKQFLTDPTFTVPESYITYNKQVWWEDSKQITWKQALGNSFDYDLDVRNIQQPPPDATPTNQGQLF